MVFVLEKEQKNGQSVQLWHGSLHKIVTKIWLSISYETKVDVDNKYLFGNMNVYS